MNKRMVKKAFLFFLVLLALGQAVVFGYVQQQKLTPSGGGSFDRSGWSVSISGDGNTSLVGAPYGDISGNIDQGSADVFVRKNGEWTQQQKMTSSDGASFDRLGWSVSVSDDGSTIVAGAPYCKIGSKTEQGSAYVFERSSGKWVQQQKLVASDGATLDHFGWSASISKDGNTIVVGAPYSKSNNRTEQGSAYVFIRSNGKWVQQRKLVASRGRTFDRFGWYVSASNAGNTLLVGAPESNSGKNVSKGSAYIFFSSMVPDLTMTEWGIIIIVLLGALGSGYYFWRKKRTYRKEVHQ